VETRFPAQGDVSKSSDYLVTELDAKRPLFVLECISCDLSEILCEANDLQVIVGEDKH